jgi:RHS repeat-associated protein
VFTTRTVYDVLNRPARAQGPSAAAGTADITVPTYNETRKLEAVDVFIRGAANATHFVTNIDYNERGQRERIAFGNGVSSVYKYDPLTFRLIGLVTARNADPELFWDDPSQVSSASCAGDVLQYFGYTFDPVGNPTYVADLAQEVIYFDNAKVDPSADYTYDAVYRLLQALGREHIGQGRAPDAYDAFRSGNPQPGDGTQMRRYTQQYAYDDAGNLTSLGNSGSWSRAFTYASNNNQLLTALSAGDAFFNYSYDPHGCMEAMPQLSTMDWDFGDRLRHVVLSASATAPQEAWYGYSASGKRMRKVVTKGSFIEERLYIGPFERFRRYHSATVVLERKTFHVMDDARRLAMVDTPTDTPAASAETQLIRYQYANHLGSACVEADDAAKVISYEEYYPFGSTSYQGVDQTREVPAKRYRYTAKERDEESGLEYHGARYCAPWLARWTQPDPAGLAGGANRYCYASNNPVRLADPDGRQPRANSQDEVTPPQPPPPEGRLPDDLPEPTTLPSPALDPIVPRFEKENPQPPIENSGPATTAFVVGDVGAYADRHPPRLGSIATELNLFLLGGSQLGAAVFTSYGQLAVRVRTSAEIEQGFIGTAGGQTGTGTPILSAGYQLHQGTVLNTRDDAPFQHGGGNLYSLSLASTPQENPRTSAANLTGSYVRAQSLAWGGGSAGIDFVGGVNFAARGSVSGRDVWGSLNPYLGANVSHQFGSVTLNAEFAVGANLGAALVNPMAGDPSFPRDARASFGLGLQKQVGEHQDYTFGVEALGSFEAHSNVPGPDPWTAGLAFTVSAY